MIKQVSYCSVAPCFQRPRKRLFHLSHVKTYEPDMPVGAEHSRACTRCLKKYHGLHETAHRMALCRRLGRIGLGQIPGWADGWTRQSKGRAMPYRGFLR